MFLQWCLFPASRLENRCKHYLNNVLYLPRVCLPWCFVLNFPTCYDSTQGDDWLVWWVEDRDKLPHLPFTHPVNEENMKEPFTESAHMSTNDYNAAFVKCDDFPHHRTSSILIETSASCLICLCSSQIPASQNNSEVGKNVKQLVCYSTAHGDMCSMFCLRMMMCLEEKRNLPLTAPQCNCLKCRWQWCIEKQWSAGSTGYQRSSRPCFSPSKLEENFCIMPSGKINR